MITLSSGNVQTPAGLAVPNGSITFQLNVDATVIAAPYGIVLAETVVTFQFDSTGNLQSGAQIYSNAELNPQNVNGLGTYYLVTFYDANGARVNKNPMWWQFPEVASSTVNISTMTPYAVLGGNIIFYPIPVGGGGSVTSVSFTGDGTVLSATPSTPVISAGTLTAALLTQSAKTFLAGPTTGAAATPTFRAIVAADIAGLITPASPVNGIQFNLGGVFGGSSAFTFNSVNNQFALMNSSTLTPAALVSLGGNGLLVDSSLGLFAVAEIIQGHNNVNASLILVNEFAPGNSGSARATYTAFTVTDDGGFGIEAVQQNPTAPYGGLGLNSTGVVELGTNNTDGSFTELKTTATGQIQFYINSTGNFDIPVFMTRTATTWVNQTAATSLVDQNSPALIITGSYWNGSASAADTWTIFNDVTTNPGTSNLTFGHSGRSGGTTVGIVGPPVYTLGKSASGFTSVVTWFGSTSGSASVVAAPIAGTPNPLALPTTTPTTGMVLTAITGNPTGTVWTSLAASNLSNGTTGSGSVVLATAPTINGLTFPAASGGAVVTQTVASGTASLGTSLIGSGAKASTVTVTATGALTTDTLMADFNADPTAVTGYAPSAAGMLTILKFPTSDNVNFVVINNTGASITPGAVTLNWRVVR